MIMFPFFTEADINLASGLETFKFLADDIEMVENEGVELYTVHEPDAEFGFLHEAAVIVYHGTLYASWYNCPVKELKGHTPIRGRRSTDGGKTWSEIEVIDEDPTGSILFCPPVYGIDQDKLYMLVNEMVAPDHIHALNLYILNDEGAFEKLWSRPIPFKLNTNVMTLPNGKLMLSGRIAELDGFPNTPAVLISDSGRIDAEWRLVYIAENGDLPDGEKLLHPEICPIIEENEILMFCRNDRRKVPLLYRSEDNGESWEGPFTHDIPLVCTKMYAGKLSDGRRYLVGNIDKLDRTKLVIYFSEANSKEFSQRLIIEETEKHGVHYPVAYESDGKLFIIYSFNHTWERRGAKLAVIDFQKRK